MYTVYVLRSLSTGHLYTGSSSNFADRLERHRRGEARYTRGRGPWEVVHLEEFETLSEAVRRERALKTGQGRAWLSTQLNASAGPPEAD